jgi:tRNA modification GTPase
MVEVQESIAAIATPSGRGGIGIIRVSGPDVEKISKLLIGRVTKNRYAEYLPIYDTSGELIDQGIILRFKAPFSFTGEDVLEVQAHGGPVILDQIMQVIVNAGVRAARPGEFSERAFLNGKLDLAQAEAIADLIDASSKQAAQSALRSLQGEFSRQINLLIEQLIELRIYVESAIDFPEEEIDFLSDGVIESKLNSTNAHLLRVLDSAQQGNILREGMHLVLAGLPNAGKSSLLNQLAGEETAIVTEIAGTTRDLLKIEISLDGLPLHITDTAGLRESSDIVEQEGIKRAWSAIDKSDLVLFLIDASNGPLDSEEEITMMLPEKKELLIIHNKIDLVGEDSKVIRSPAGETTHIYLSAKTGLGVPELKEYLKNQIGYSGTGEGSFMARRRHIDAIERAKNCITHSFQLLSIGSGELVAEELRQAQECLGEITGKFTSDDLLGTIFTSFCIGK